MSHADAHGHSHDHAHPHSHPQAKPLPARRSQALRARLVMLVRVWPSLLAMSAGQRGLIVLPLLLLLWLAVFWALGGEA